MSLATHVTLTAVMKQNDVNITTSWISAEANF
jgi:hypothetical protein